MCLSHNSKRYPSEGRDPAIPTSSSVPTEGPSSPQEEFCNCLHCHSPLASSSRARKEFPASQVLKLLFPPNFAQARVPPAPSLWALLFLSRGWQLLACRSWSAPQVSLGCVDASPSVACTDEPVSLTLRGESPSAALQRGLCPCCSFRIEVGPWPLTGQVQRQNPCAAGHSTMGSALLTSKHVGCFSFSMLTICTFLTESLSSAAVTLRSFPVSLLPPCSLSRGVVAAREPGDVEACID